MSDEIKKSTEKAAPIDRRELLGGTAKLATLAGLTGVAGGTAATLVGQSLLAPAPAAAARAGRWHVAPGARSARRLLRVLQRWSEWRDPRLRSAVRA